MKPLGRRLVWFVVVLVCATTILVVAGLEDDDDARVLVDRRTHPEGA